MTEADLKTRQPTLRVKTMPNDANQKGDIFGGWLMSQIDISAAIEARNYTKGLVATVAVKNLTFLKPLYVYDLVSFYTKVSDTGRSSVTIEIEVYATRFLNEEHKIVKISDATLVFVAIEKPGVKRAI